MAAQGRDGRGREGGGRALFSRPLVDYGAPPPSWIMKRLMSDASQPRLADGGGDSRLRAAVSAALIHPAARRRRRVSWAAFVLRIRSHVSQVSVEASGIPAAGTLRGPRRPRS